MKKIVKKLSMKQLLGNVARFVPVKEVPVEGKPGVIKEVPAIGETVWIANVVGIARGVKSGISNYGEWTALMGDFVAVALVGDKAAVAAKPADGDTPAVEAKEADQFRTGQLFLPDVVLHMVTAALDGHTGVEFAFKIGIIAVPTDGDQPSSTGYEYTADFLTAPKANDPLEALVNASLNNNPGEVTDTSTGEVKGGKEVAKK